MSFDGLPKAHHESLDEGEVVREYLDDLGLSFGALKGKRILDIGTGGGEFVRSVNVRGGQATGIDTQNALRPQDESMSAKGDLFVIGNAERLPFPDSSFDFVLSHAAVPNIVSSRSVKGDTDIEKQTRRIAALREMLRVVTEEGEVRCAPVVNSAEYQHQSEQVADAIRAIGAEAEIIHEPIDARHDSSFRLILKKKGYEPTYQ